MPPLLDKAASFAGTETQGGMTVGQWMPIETAPDRDLILMYYPATGTARGRKGFTHPERITVGGRDDTPNRRPTHWQPLPAPPGPSCAGAPLMTAVPEMVERVARALASAHGEDLDSTVFSLEELRSVPGWQIYASDARAAIAAMREPNEAMRYAVWYDQYITNGGTPKEADFLARKKVADEVQKQQDLSSFSALIDAALGSTEGAR